MNKIFGKIIAKGRIDKDMSRKDLAEMVGCSHAIVGEWERGKKTPGLDKVIQIERALDTKIFTKEFMNQMEGDN